MIQVTRSTVIEAPIDAVWQVIRDFNGHDRWHPVVRSSSLEDGRLTDQLAAVRNFMLQTGERVRERLLTLSDNEYQLRYSIVDAQVPLHDYVATMKLRRVTDSDHTLWSWTSRFNTPVGLEDELSELVARDVYEAGFDAVRDKLKRTLGAVTSPTPLMASTVTATEHAKAMPTQSIRVDRYGGTEVLRLVQDQAPPPQAGQVRLQQSAVGVNFIDIYCRTGLFDLLQPPGVLGMEAAGVVLDKGPGVQHLNVGDRVVYACEPVGAYTQIRTMDATLVSPLPDEIDIQTAARVFLKGLTASFLLHSVHALKPGQHALIYAPVGGVGSLLCQWARHIGATVIGATSTDDKARQARALGADHVITPGTASLEEQVLELTHGRGVDVVYDAVGKDTFTHSVAALAPCGHLVSYGQASGAIGNQDIGALSAKSVTLSRPNFGHYTDSQDKLQLHGARLFNAMSSRILSVHVGATLPLSEAARAHELLEQRASTGSVILEP